MNTSTTSQALHILNSSAERLAVPIDYLTAWARHAGLSHAQLEQLLYIANRYALDPFTEEIMWADAADQGGKPFITIDGWMKILNAQAHFCGLQFREATTVSDEIPVWMECTIYRDDRVLPIIVKEYFEEIKTEHFSWTTHPRRMLRHRTLQQAIRLAFGISSPDTYRQSNTYPHPSTEIMHKEPMKANTPGKTRTSVLKEHLQSASTIASSDIE